MMTFMMWQVGLLATATADPSCETPPPRYAISDATNIELALKTHGYVILTGHDSGLPAENITLGLPAQVFGGRLLSDGANTLHAVHDENEKMQAQFLERQAACKESGNCADDLSSWSSSFAVNVNPLLPHTDGYVYGDHMPDMIFLHSEQVAARGGENFVIDGEAILSELLASDPDAARLAREATIDLTERMSAGGITTGREAFGPLFRRRADGTLWWRRQLKTRAYEQGVEQHADGRPSTVIKELQPYQSLWTPAGAGNNATEAMLVAVDAAIQRATRDAPRFTLAPSESLLVDNYRMLHGREGYDAPEDGSEAALRKMWRVWCWTTRSDGLPVGVKEVGSPLEAEQLL
jgi:hypothetical protein